MKRNILLALPGTALIALTGCIEETASTPPPSMPSAAEQACLRDVTRTTGNPDVRLIESSFSEAGTQVIVAVGPTGRWSCIAYSDGSTGGIQSITDEGSL